MLEKITTYKDLFKLKVKRKWDVFTREELGKGTHPLVKGAMEEQDKRLHTNEKMLERYHTQEATKKEVKKTREHMRNAEAEEQARELWAEVDENIKNMLKGGSESYWEWATGMNHMVTYLKVFNKACAITFFQNTYLANPSWDKSNPNWHKTKKEPVVVAPNVTYNATMDENGSIKTAVNAYDHPVGDKPKEAFDTALGIWAFRNGYSMQPDPAHPGQFTFTDRNGDQLVDKAAFDALKYHPTKGMHTFLSEELAIKDLKEIQEAEPAPAPGI